jgi:hypothetical protein
MMTDKSSNRRKIIANESTDFVPPRRVYMDDILVNDPQLGTVPFWKSLIWNTANLRNAMARADSADSFDEKTPLAEEDKPPPPIGAMGPTTAREDQEPGSQEGEERERAAAMEEVMARIGASLDRLSARLDELERKWAEGARRSCEATRS